MRGLWVGAASRLLEVGVPSVWKTNDGSEMVEVRLFERLEERPGGVIVHWRRANYGMLEQTCPIDSCARWIAITKAEPISTDPVEIANAIRERSWK